MMMQPMLRPVKIGLFFGLLCLLFGIFWAAYLTVNHEGIHRDLADRERARLEETFLLSSPKAKPAPQPHEHGAHPHDKTEAQTVKAEAIHGDHGGHDNPLIAEAHERLTRGHIHAMGLGLVSIAVSLILVFVSARLMIKTFASACVGVGGFFYPFAWIIMGYRTASIGSEAAAKSVVPIVAFSVSLVAIGILISMFYIVMAIVKAD
ncbi:MAG: hypothetical protein HY886_05590 [Deltaproteobacteria bacterium]|nr:hypothetical protein [Deltaproteobacteria bacterium]